MFSLLSMIWEYKASYLSGFLFFFVAMVRRHASPPSLCALTTAQLRLTTTHRVLSAVGRFCDGRHLCGRHVRDGCRWRVRADPEQRARPTPIYTAPRACACTGGEFWSAFFLTQTIALPMMFYFCKVVSLKALVLSLSGVIVAIIFGALSAMLRARADDDAFHAW